MRFKQLSSLNVVLWLVLGQGICFADMGPGVVVTSVLPNSEGARAGVKNGDLLLFGFCGDVQYAFQSPFQFKRFTQERHSCSSQVKITGLRTGQKYAWALGSGNWGITVHPHFTKEAETLYAEGLRLADENRTQEAISHWNTVADNHDRSPDWLRPWLASTLGELFASKRQWKDADQQFGLAVEFANTAGSLVSSQVLSAWAEAFLERSDWANAEKYYQQALQRIQHTAPESLALAECLNGLSTIALRRGDLRVAEQYSSRDLAITEKLAPESLSLAHTLTNLGSIEWRRGELASAEKYFRRSLIISERLLPDSLYLALALSNFGSLLAARADLIGAETYYQRALSIARRHGANSLEVAACLNNLGSIARQQGNLRLAEIYLLESLAIKQKASRDSLSAASTMINLGWLRLEVGDIVAAEHWFRESLDILEERAPHSLSVADGLHSMAEVSRHRGDLNDAEAFCRRALMIREQLAPGSSGQAESLACLARIMRLTNRSLEASQLYQRFVAVLETQVAHLGGGEEAHYTFRSKYVDYYSDYIDLLIAQQNVDGAFEVAERRRAQTLLQTLSSSRLKISKDIPQNLLEREQLLRDLFAVKNNNRIRLQASGRRAEELVNVNREISEIRAKWDTVEAEIREHNRNYAGLTRPRVLSIGEIQREVLDADTVLLEYSLGQERSHLWIVSIGSSTVIELPSRNEIEDLARHLYDLLTVRGRQKVDGAGATGVNVAKADTEFPQVAAALSNLVLGPAAELIKRKRLLIVSDGALELTPFAALPVPFSSGEAIPMIVEHEIVNLPSVAVLAEIRRQSASRNQPARAIAVLADPVFDSSDERVRANRQRRPISKERSRTEFIANRSVSNTASSANRGQFVRLPFTRQEANAIQRASPNAKNLIALDFRANRSLAISGELAKYRIVHFATHGILDSARPELSGLILSMVDEAGEPQNGFLGLEDIYNLNLPADLVVLSGCETGLGKEIRGEGLIGLTRGFFFAGANRIIASSWRVDDFATAELQKRVYRHMAANRMRPAAALRAAQIEIAKTTHWKFPFYWAAFEVFGEWN